MGTTISWRSGAATDAGLLRSVNEDRYYLDDENGIFLVVDGLGGHAAGEKAAETAVEVIRGELERRTGSAARGIDVMVAPRGSVWRSLDVFAPDARDGTAACRRTGGGFRAAAVGAVRCRRLPPGE